MARTLSHGRNFILGVLCTGLSVMAQGTTSWSSHLKDGIAAIGSGHYEQAVEILTALAEESKSFPAADLRRAKVAFSLASAYQYQGRLAAAEPLYLEARTLLEAAGPEAGHTLGMTLHGLAQLRMGARGWNEAEELLRSAARICGEADGEMDPCAIAARMHLGELYVLADRSLEAEPILAQAVAIFREISPARDDLLADALRNLADAYRLEGRYALAGPLFKESLELSTRLGECHPLVADRLVDLAGLYRLEHDTARGEPLLKKAVRIYEMNHDPHLADALNELGLAAIDEGKYAIAKEHFERSLALYEKTFGPETVAVASAQAGLAQAYLGERNYKKAESFIQRAIEIGRAVLGDANFGVAKLFMVAARVQEREHRPSEADLFYRQALVIYRRSLPNDHPDRTEAEQQYARFSKSFQK
jgi:tetratricopeptide (TPR) repeat protein